MRPVTGISSGGEGSETFPEQTPVPLVGQSTLHNQLVLQSNGALETGQGNISSSWLKQIRVSRRFWSWGSAQTKLLLHTLQTGVRTSASSLVTAELWEMRWVPLLYCLCWFRVEEVGPWEPRVQARFRVQPASSSLRPASVIQDRSHSGTFAYRAMGRSGLQQQVVNGSGMEGALGVQPEQANPPAHVAPQMLALS